MLGQFCDQPGIVPIQYLDRHQRFGLAAGLGPFARDGRRGAYDVFRCVNDMLLAAEIVAEHHPRGGRRDKFFVERHEIFG